MAKEATMTDDLGAPTQDEIDTFNAAQASAQLAAIEANAKVAAAQYQLDLERAIASGTQRDLAKLAVEGAKLQQRVNFAQQAAAASKIVRSGPVVGLRR